MIRVEHLQQVELLGRLDLAIGKDDLFEDREEQIEKRRAVLGRPTLQLDEQFDVVQIEPPVLVEELLNHRDFCCVDSLVGQGRRHEFIEG